MYRFKELAPDETLLKIKRYMQSAELSTTEKWYESEIINVFSVRVTIDGTSYGTNGKGSTKELALASAYGELIERLGNGVLFKLGEQQKTADVGFVYFPDEIKAGKYSYRDVAGNAVVDTIISSIGEKDKAIGLWDLYYPNQICIPYTKLFMEEKVYVPYAMLQAYGSNGMAAGNTAEEALVQAISEVFERHCLQKIVMEKICPPIMKNSSLSRRFPLIGSILNDIGKKPEYSVEIRDCGLGLGIPVISVCLKSNVDNAYAVSFGAHPCLESAIERAITELFQGRSIDMVCSSHFQRSIRDEKANMLSLLKNGIGQYPSSFFSYDYDYPAHSYDECDFMNNKLMLSYMKDQLEKIKVSVFAHTIMLGEMYITHAIIPGFSEVYCFDEFHFKIIDMQRRLKKCIKRLYLLSEVELQTFLEFIDYSRKTPEYDTDLSKNVSVNVNIESKKNLLVLLSGFYQLGKYERCMQYLEILRKEIDEKEYECIREFFIMCKNDDTFEIWDILSTKYDDAVCKNCMNYLDLKVVIETYYISFGKSNCNNENLLKSLYKLKKGMVVL